MIDTIAASGVVAIRGWKSLSVGGRPIIGRVCEEIRNAQLFVADLTGLNPNVLFELGYAITRKRRVWLLLDTAIERAKLDFDRFQILTTVGYRGHSNSTQLVQDFFTDQPYADLDNCLYDELSTTITGLRRATLLYLKAQIRTEASTAVTRRIAACSIPSIVDDPEEVPNQPLSWYLNQVDSASAVVCHLLSVQHTSWQLNNAKQAFVAGLAHGLAKPLLMLAHTPYKSPLDYRDLLHTHDTAAAAEGLFDKWIAPLLESVQRQVANAQRYENQINANSELSRVALGEWIAEYEADSVSEYFIPTSTYNEALSSTHSIFVGRKGTGKSATFYKLKDEIARDPRNHVCLIKPVGYELEGVLQMLRPYFSCQNCSQLCT